MTAVETALPAITAPAARATSSSGGAWARVAAASATPKSTLPPRPSAPPMDVGVPAMQRAGVSDVLGLPDRGPVIARQSSAPAGPVKAPAPPAAGDAPAMSKRAIKRAKAAAAAAGYAVPVAATASAAPSTHPGAPFVAAVAPTPAPVTRSASAAAEGEEDDDGEGGGQTSRRGGRRRRQRKATESVLPAETTLQRAHSAVNSTAELHSLHTPSVVLPVAPAPAVHIPVEGTPPSAATMPSSHVPHAAPTMDTSAAAYMSTPALLASISALLDGHALRAPPPPPQQQQASVPVVSGLPPAVADLLKSHTGNGLIPYSVLEAAMRDAEPTPLLAPQVPSAVGHAGMYNPWLPQTIPAPVTADASPLRPSPSSLHGGMALPFATLGIPAGGGLTPAGGGLTPAGGGPTSSSSQEWLRSMFPHATVSFSAVSPRAPAPAVAFAAPGDASANGMPWWSSATPSAEPPAATHASHAAPSNRLPTSDASPELANGAAVAPSNSRRGRRKWA